MDQNRKFEGTTTKALVIVIELPNNMLCPANEL